jgi:alkylhydroperoxidase/carboxymuconolactone decarboxylase family protein YurZ
MTKNWLGLIADLSAFARRRTRRNESIFGNGKGGLRSEALDSKTKELITLAISVEVRCASHFIRRPP